MSRSSSPRKKDGGCQSCQHCVATPRWSSVGRAERVPPEYHKARDVDGVVHLFLTDVGNTACFWFTDMDWREPLLELSTTTGRALVPRGAVTCVSCLALEAAVEREWDPR